jgi:hypothetical protein
LKEAERLVADGAEHGLDAQLALLPDLADEPAEQIRVEPPQRPRSDDTTM